MTLDDFRNLDTPLGDQNAARCHWVAQLIIGQYPRLRLGDHMTGPVDVFLNGRKADISAYTHYTDDQFTPVGPRPATVSAASVRCEQRQVFDGHPWLTIPVTDQNYLHMYTVEIVSGFGDKKAGNLITVRYGDKPLSVPLTQEMIDESSTIIARFALSK